MTSFAEYMEAIFGEIARAAGRENLLGQLKTKDLPPAGRAEKLARLNRLKGFGGGAFQLIGGGFVYRFRHEKQVYLAVLTDHLNDQQKADLDDAMSKQSADRVDLDEITFCFLAHQARGLYRIKSKYRSEASALEVVDVFGAEEAYAGHDLLDVMSWFEDLSIYSLGSNSIIEESNIAYAAAVVVGCHEEFRSGLLPIPLAAKISALLALPNVNPDNVYLALTAMHWKHAFLEIYRLMEAVYYLPWILDFKGAGNYPLPALELAQQCRVGLAWKQQERASIRKVFEMLPGASVTRPDLLASSIFNGVAGKDRTPGSIGERIYKVRNQLVHQEEFEDLIPIKIDGAAWPILVDYMTDIVFLIYNSNSVDVGYSYSLEGKELAVLR